MRLEKVVLNGFKSFADKIELDFVDGITAIVGPNGCGKSNVVDAMKWVLGNQSPKSLRSGHMSDVIFSGSSSRKPSGMAQVSLHFSEVASIGLEQNDLEISRRLYRSGESEYLINSRPCRLKDIRELFMDTGIGVSAYSIIEQGQIDQLLHASKTDRRIIFEEAAGISKYKAHKKEALRKLERTEQNMLRLADIISEVQKQLRSIKLQAGKARNFLQYSERLKELRVNYSLAEYHKIVTQTNDKKHVLGQLEDKFGLVVAEVAKNDASVSNLGNAIVETEVKINECDNSLVAAKSKIEQQFERIEFLKNRLGELQERKSSASDQIRKFNAQSNQFVEELAECEIKLKNNEKVFAEKNQQLLDLENIINEITTQCKNIEANLDDEKSGIIDIVRRTAQLHNEIKSINTYRNSLAGQKDRLSGRANTARVQLEQMLTEKAQYRARLDDINKVIAELQQSLETKRHQIDHISSTQTDANGKLADAKELRSGLSSEFKVLGDMEARREGLSNSIKDILQSQTKPDQNRYDYIEGIVADLISADPKYADAVEAALEGKTDTLIINSTEKFLADTDIRQKLQSRVNLICIDKIDPFVDTQDFSQYPQVLGRVVEFVNHNGKHTQLAWKLLGHTILVESIEIAIELSQQMGSKYKFVTTAGEVFDGHYSVSIGPVGKATGLISRKSRLGHLESELANISSQIKDLEAQLDQSSNQSKHLTKLCKDFRTAIYEANTEKINTESKLRLVEQNIKRLTDEQPVITSEIDMLEEEISQSVQKEYDSEQKLQELEAVNTERTSRIAELEVQFAEKKNLSETKMSLLTELKVQLGRIGEQQKSIKQRIMSLQSQLQHGQMTLESARNDLLSCNNQIIQAEHDILSTQASVSELFVVKESAQQVSSKMHQKVQQMLDEQKQTEHLLKQKRSEQAEIEQEIHHFQLELSQLSVKDEDLTQRVSEELQIDLAQAYEDFEQTHVDWEQVREEINDLRRKIERLGNVNVDAIQEQEQLEQRYEFLAQQAQDLNKSKTQLEQLISKINKESIEKFRVTFDDVRHNFQILFRKLFGGGKADILLEDPDDILECGIEIVARPPGKETRSISLLSGGEKTLTALGLLFAIFKSKPSPFCFLDEVDAALDEANNERFNMIVQEFQKHSQFIIITHSKRTMSIADVLFGITMQTQGVSKKISVAFDRIDSETDAAAVA